LTTFFDPSILALKYLQPENHPLDNYPIMGELSITIIVISEKWENNLPIKNNNYYEYYLN